MSFFHRYANHEQRGNGESPNGGGRHIGFERFEKWFCLNKSSVQLSEEAVRNWEKTMTDVEKQATRHTLESMWFRERRDSEKVKEAIEEIKKKEAERKEHGKKWLLEKSDEEGHEKVPLIDEEEKHKDKKGRRPPTPFEDDQMMDHDSPYDKQPRDSEISF